MKTFTVYKINNHNGSDILSHKEHLGHNELDEWMHHKAGLQWKAVRVECDQTGQANEYFLVCGSFCLVTKNA